MLITNPLTRQVLNANPKGHNQYVNPDGPADPAISARAKALEAHEKAVRLSTHKTRGMIMGPGGGTLTKFSKPNSEISFRDLADAHTGMAQEYGRQLRASKKIDRLGLDVGQAINPDPNTTKIIKKIHDDDLAKKLAHRAARRAILEAIKYGE